MRALLAMLLLAGGCSVDHHANDAYDGCSEARPCPGGERCVHGFCLGGTPPMDSGIDAAGEDSGVDAGGEDAAFDAGDCMPTCVAPERCCDGRCVDVTDDEDHCGMCGRGCAAGQRCCDFDCRTIETDMRHCGECGNACELPTTCCSGSMCRITC